MYAALIEILNQEIGTLQVLLQTEQEKRDAILKASGKQLNELTGKTEQNLVRLDQLEAGKQTWIRSHVSSEDGQNLTSLIQSARNKDSREAGLLESVANRLRTLARELKIETDQNNRLLESTARSVGRFIQNIRELSNQDSRNTYGPGGIKKGSTTDSRAVLLDARL